MQADEFEKKIQNKMEGFELVPDSEVWKEVSFRIEKEKKKRRVFLYWLFAGFAFLAGTSALWFINNKNITRPVINEVNNNVSKRENYKIKQNINNSLQNINKVQKASSAKSKHYLKSELNRVSKPEVKNKDFTKTTFAKVLNKEHINKEQNETREKDPGKVYEAEKHITQRLSPHRFYNPQLAATSKVDTEVRTNSVIDRKTNFTKDASANTAAKAPVQIKISKKWKVGFTVYSGISNNISGLPVLEKSLADYSSSQVSIPGGSYNSGGNAGYSINTANNFKSAFSFGFGIFTRKQVTKRISFSLGGDFHSYKAKSTVGSKVNQQRIFYDSSVQESISVNDFYTVGNSVTYSNKYQLLELPINLALQLNKNQERPLLISAGISPGYLLGSNALYANPSANVYYVDKEKFYHFQLSAQSGLLFPISGSYKYLLSAGPAVQYGFTNAAKAVTGSSQHLFFTGLKANIIFK